MKKGLIFDVDGTLIRTDLALAEGVIQKIINETGDGTYVPDMVPYFWWGGNGIGRGEILRREFHVQNLKKFWEVWNFYAGNFDYTKQFKSRYEDVAESLRLLNLEGVPLGIVTDPPGLIARPQIKLFLPHEYFDPILTLADTPGLKSKPDPSGLIFCAKQMGLSPDELDYVGDATNDLIAAREAGMGFIRINRGEHEIYIPPENEINSLYELLK